MASKARNGKQEWAYSILRSRIVDGTYGPGHRLVIDAIARELKVSPMPVREAIRRLEAEHWVVYQRNLGAQVAPLDEASWTEAMTTLAVLDGYATALAAPQLEAADFTALRAINDEMREAIAALDVMLVSQRNQAFHRHIYDRCPNGYLRRQIQTIMERINTLRATIFMYIPTRGLVSCEEHEQLLVMLESGADAREIEHFAREHKLHTVTAYEQRQARDAAAAPA